MQYKDIFLVIGPPGTGKTSFLAKQIKKMANTSKPVVVSLTNTAAKEIAGRDIPVPKNMVGTLHSLAYNSINIKQPVADICHYISDKTGRPCQSKNLDDDFHLSTIRSEDEFEMFQQIDCLRHRMVPQDMWPAKSRDLYQSWQEWKFETGTVDFTDMIEQAIQQEAPPPGNPDAIIADELQDFSKLEYTLLKMWYERTGCLIGCGDPWQSLYTWRGADPDIFLDPDVPKEKQRVLHQSYRVPRAVHAEAVQWARQLSNHTDIEYKPTDIEGSVQQLNANYRYPEGILHIIDRHLDRGQSVMVMGSCGYLLRPLISTLRSQGRPFSNPWRPLNGGWNPLGPKKGVMALQRILGLLRPNLVPGTVWTAEEFWNWAKPLEARAIFHEKVKGQVAARIKNKTIDPLEPWTKSLIEYVNTEKLVELGGYLQRDKIDEAVHWWLDRLQASQTDIHAYPAKVVLRAKNSDKNFLIYLALIGKKSDFFPLYRGRGVKSLQTTVGQGVTSKIKTPQKVPNLYVGTIHSFKGSEADVVIIIPDLSHQGYCAWLTSGPNKDSVIRMFYVALTRARDTVYICSPGSNMAAHI